jgi:enoyl-CoA hydratase/3-hydroxyacyl-CoA dehydrogenase
VASWLDGSNAGNADEQVARLAKKIGFKAPVALRIAAELVALSARVTTAEGVAEELRRLPEVFGTADAAEGITSVLERRRPNFIGA